ncbi:MAG: hypothetical protein KDH09_02755 [Chrysiogenetes bacterium]|nr:hypothetical protein [Chrysiogenetes bacterium]
MKRTTLKPAITVVLSSLAALVLGAAVSPVRLAPDQIVRKHPELAFWRMGLPYGSEAGTEPAPRAFEEIGGFLHMTDAMREAVDRQSEKFAELIEVRDDLIRLDFEDFFERDHPLFFNKRTGERAIRVEGLWNDRDQYDLFIGNLPFNQQRPVRMGNLAAEFSVKYSATNEDAVLLNTNGHFDMGTMLYREMLESWQVLQTQMDRNRIFTEEWNKKVSLSGVGMGPGLDEDDIEVLSQIYASIPNVIDVVSKFMTVEDVVDLAKAVNGEDVTELNWTLKLDMEKFEEFYPETLGELALLLEKVSFNTVLRTESGGSLARISYSNENHLLAVHMLLRDGGVVVADADGVPTDETVNPASVKSLSYVAQTNVVAHFLGLRFYIDNLPIECTYRAASDWDADKRLSKFRLQFRKAPEIHAEGALFYIFPAGMVNFLSFGTMIGDAEDFFAGMVEGNDRAGAVLDLEFMESQGYHRLRGDLTVEVPYKAISPIAREFIQREWDDIGSPSSEESLRLIDDLRIALRKDFEKIDPRR